ncbi:MAG: adenylyltransferase/cytidyltransferase family protein [Halioglobus sp.]
MKTVITYGTFDLFHVGHVNLLEKLKSLGDRLVVGCSTDEFNRQKGKSAIFSYADRERILRCCRFVDDVFPENDLGQKPSDISRFEASIFAIGDDWVGKFDELQEFVDVVYVPRTKGVSTTSIKGFGNMLGHEKLLEIKGAVSHLHQLLEEL